MLLSWGFGNNPTYFFQRSNAPIPIGGPRFVTPPKFVGWLGSLAINLPPSAPALPPTPFGSKLPPAPPASRFNRSVVPKERMQLVAQEINNDYKGKVINKSDIGRIKRLYPDMGFFPVQEKDCNKPVPMVDTVRLCLDGSQRLLRATTD